jgi:hypothetical protein
MRFSFATIRRLLTSALAAGAVALTGMVATPAQARNDDLIKFLLGATAVAVIAHAARKGNAQVVVAPPSNPRALPEHCREVLHVRHREVHVFNAQCLQNAHVRHLPDHCYEVVRTNHGNRGVYRAQCLSEAGFHVVHAQPPRHVEPPRHQAKALPQSCEIRYRARGELQRGYDAQCLRDSGLRRLPESCVARRSDGQIFNAQCLIEAGYRRR